MVGINSRLRTEEGQGKATTPDKTSKGETLSIGSKGGTSVTVEGNEV